MKLRASVILASGLVWLGTAAQAAANLEQRQELLARLLHRLPSSPPWEEWLERTGELPPDFDTLPRLADLPDPLLRADGRVVQTPEDWSERRQELLGLFAYYLTGTVPAAPGNVRVGERHVGSDGPVILERLTLEFGPGHQATLGLELIVPVGPGPFPVFLTQHNHRAWALVAVSRGYVGCVYAGSDSQDDTGAWARLWPEHDWSKLTRRAWAASRVIDYLVTRPEVDRQRIALTGHSRNGKTALIAAALDERIGAVISSSSGAGGACSFRRFSEAQFGEGIELLTRVFPDWLHPRLRFFAGREHQLPLFQHQLVACVAPRPTLISTALNDNVESVWAIEQTYQGALPVFTLLGAADALQLRYRAGGHSTRAEDIEAYVDWLDAQFGRRPLPPARRDLAAAPGSAIPAPIFPTYTQWEESSGERIRPEEFPDRSGADLLADDDGVALTDPAAWPARRQEIRRRIDRALGEPPPGAVGQVSHYGAEPNAEAALLGRAAPPPELVRESLNFGNYLRADLYYRTNVVGTDRRLPVFVWLHPISVSHGYVAGYDRGEKPHLALARSGYAVFAFDQLGFGSRILEIRDFYRRYPRWSLLGKLLRDVRAAVDAVSSHPRIDPAQVYLVGYGLGGLVGLHAAALDERVAGVIAVAAFTPMRSDTADKGTGGLARWTHWLPLLPRLGGFRGHEARLPYDYDEVLALIAPRPALVITPGLDYESTREDLRQCMTRARRVYAWLGAPDSLVFQRTEDYNHFTPELIWCLCGVETIR